MTGVARVINPGYRFPGGRDVVDLHEGGDHLILLSDGGLRAVILLLLWLVHQG